MNLYRLNYTSHFSNHISYTSSALPLNIFQTTGFIFSEKFEYSILDFLCYFIRKSFKTRQSFRIPTVAADERIIFNG